MTIIHKITDNKISSWHHGGFNLKRFDISHQSPISLSRIFHDEIAFIAFEGMTCRSKQNGLSYLETPDDIVIRDAGQVFSLDAEPINLSGAICREILVSPTVLAQALEAMEYGHLQIDFRQPVLNNPNLKKILFNTLSILEMTECNLEKSSYLLHFLVNFVEQTKLSKAKIKIKKSTENFSVIIDYLRSYYHENISLDDLSNIIHMNPYVLIRKFRQATGVTPHEYLTIIRVINARTLIHAKLNLSQVAMQCGFSDQSHLTRKFKRLVGVTPGRYQSLNI